jgi:hypothetical protein
MTQKSAWDGWAAMAAESTRLTSLSEAWVSEYAMYDVHSSNDSGNLLAAEEYKLRI